MVNFIEIFRKNVTYSNIKSHQKLGLPLHLENAISGDPQPFEG